ncbi:MAG: HPr family phosphocarrier protein [Clostridiales bacterium]|nr:HPr family phosphocarrier protein [Clostridiales bacterium]
MIKSTDIKVRLDSVEQVREFVETMRKYDGDVDVYSTNRNYLVDGKSILGVFSLGLDQELTVKFYNGTTESFISTLQPFMQVA